MQFRLSTFGSFCHGCPRSEKVRTAMKAGGGNSAQTPDGQSCFGVSGVNTSLRFAKMSRMTAAQLRIQKMVKPFICQENQAQQFFEEPQNNIQQPENSSKEQTEELFTNTQLPENSSKEYREELNTNPQLPENLYKEYREELNTNTQQPENLYEEYREQLNTNTSSK